MDYFRQKTWIYVHSHNAYRNVHYLGLAEFLTKYLGAYAETERAVGFWNQNTSPHGLIFHRSFQIMIQNYQRRKEEQH